MMKMNPMTIVENQSEFIISKQARLKIFRLHGSRLPKINISKLVLPSKVDSFA